MSEETKIPAAPKHLPAAVAKQWQDTYAKTLAQAKIDTPDNERAQRIIALKTANRLLTVPAPQSAADIDALADWQVVKRGEREGVKYCLTIDGRKYSFPIEAPKSQQADVAKMTKAELVSHAADVHGLQLDPAASKADMIAAIQAKAGE